MPITTHPLPNPAPWGANKAAKLSGYWPAIEAAGARTLVVPGGAYSNLLWAVAAVGQARGLTTVGLIRGEELKGLTMAQTPGLARLQALGMQIELLDRPTYRSVCKQGPATTIPQLWDSLDRPYFIPEGASGPLALVGLIAEAKTWVGDLNPEVQLVVPVGTGATMAGITIARYEAWVSLGQGTLPPPTLGFAPFRDQAYCTSLVLDQISNYFTDRGIADPMALAIQLAKVIAVPDLGRYGKPRPAVLASVANHKARTGQQLNPIYTGFCLAALEASFERAELDPRVHYVLVDTGGAA